MRRLRVVPAAAVAVLVMVTGCGGSGSVVDASSPAAAMQRVADKVSADSGSFTVEATGDGTAMHGTGSYRGGADPAMRITLGDASGEDAQPGTMEQILVDGVMYMRFTGPDIAMPAADDKWMKLPLGDLGSGLGELLSGSAMADPREQLELLLSAGEVREVGTETIDGVDTTHYAGDLTTDELADSEMSKPFRDLLREDLQHTGGDRPMELDLWVDAEDRPRRLVMAMPDSGAEEMTVRVDFRDFGKDVQVEAPPAEEVFDFSEFLSEGLLSQLDDADARATQLLQDLEKDLEKTRGKDYDFSDPGVLAEALKDF